MRLLHPCPGAVVTLPFGAQLSADPGYYLWLGYAGHEGVDFRAAIGTPVRAAHAGVARRHWSSGYGLYVAIESASARTVYAHLSEAQAYVDLLAWREGDDWHIKRLMQG